MPSYDKVFEKTIKQYVWWIERDSVGIALYDPLQADTKRFLSPDAAYTVTLFYYKKADHFNTLDNNSSAMTEQNELPTQFHQYLVDKAIQLGYEQYADGLQHAHYFNERFERGIREGKMFSNRGRISSNRAVKQHGF